MRRKKWGRIINVSSVLATYPQKGFSAYSASKSGLEGLTKTLALEYANKQITINAVAPGFTDTDILKVLGELGDEMSKNIPIGFMAQPEDIAECIAFLASDSARYITGEVINISGGLKF
jgi:3-oxoacyl-[acyl-carrier protein] reductase